MGLFSFLFGGASPSRVELLNDRIWISQEAKFRGVERDLLQLKSSNTDAVMLIAHFPDTLARLGAIITQHPPVTATLAQTLARDIAGHLRHKELLTINLLVAERHPLYSIDQQLLQTFEQQLLQSGKQLSCRCCITYHLSLEDPPLKQHITPQFLGILEDIGMHPDDPIEHKMVNRAITKMQKKCEATALGNRQANSATEWIEKNSTQPPKKWPEIM